MADMTIMFDNSRDEPAAFSLVRAQLQRRVLSDVRSAVFRGDAERRLVAPRWLDAVTGPWIESGRLG